MKKWNRLAIGGWLFAATAMLIGSFWLLVESIPVCSARQHRDCRAPLPSAAEMGEQVLRDPVTGLTLLLITGAGVVFLAAMFRMCWRFVRSYVAVTLSIGSDVVGIVKDAGESVKKQLAKENQ